jgi:diguanylate cyclase (GGDEF)-like protein
MNSQFLTHYFEARRKISAIVIVLSIFVIAIFILLDNYSNKFLLNSKQLTYEIANLEYIIKDSQYLYEKYKYYSDKKELDNSITHLSQSKKDISILLNGGNIKGFYYIFDTDNKIIDKIKDIKRDIDDLESSISKSLKDSSYDIEFANIIHKLTSLDKYHSARFDMNYNKFLKLRYTIYAIMFFLLLYGLYLIKSLNEEIENRTFLSYIDEDTNLQNLKGYQYEVDNLLYTFERYKSGFSIIMFDIDDFMKIFDLYGKKVSNLTLTDISSLIYQNTRQSSDILFRTDHDRFVLLCPNTSIEEGIVVAEKIRELIEKDIYGINGENITTSVSVSTAQINDNANKIYERVDLLIKISKDGGKNRLTSDLDILEEEIDDS